MTSDRQHRRPRGRGRGHSGGAAGARRWQGGRHRAGRLRVRRAGTPWSGPSPRPGRRARPPPCPPRGCPRATGRRESAAGWRSLERAPGEGLRRRPYAVRRAAPGRRRGRRRPALGRAGRTRGRPPGWTARRRRRRTPSGRCRRPPAGSAARRGPVPSAAPPTRLNGTSLPNSAQMSRSSAREAPVPHSASQASSAPAPSALPPAMPPATGMSLAMWMCTCGLDAVPRGERDRPRGPRGSCGPAGPGRRPGPRR